MNNVTFYNLIMTFKNESNKNSQITLKNVREDITAAEAKAAMNAIVSSNIFLTPLGNLVAIQSAELVAQTTTGLSLA
ncbi:MAG: DUF2922 domain-containing protein [Sarcina sp.]